MVLRSVGQAVVLLATLGKSRHWLWERWFRPFLLLSKGHRPGGQQESLRAGFGLQQRWQSLEHFLKESVDSVGIWVGNQ